MRVSREVRRRSPNRSPSAVRASACIEKFYHTLLMRPGPLLTEYDSKEYGQGIRCLFHLPSGDPGRGGKHGEKSLGVLQTRFGIDIVPHGNTSCRFLGNSAKTMLYRTGYHHLHPALSKKEHYGTGWAPAPARSV